MSDFPTDQQADPLVLQRHNRLKISVGATIAALCMISASLLWLTRDIHGDTHLHSGRPAFLISLVMWMLMSVAMMLPTAWHMISTYLDVGFAARSKNMSVPPVALLIAGYLSVWGLFSIAAAALQIELISMELIQRNGGWPPLVFSGGLFVLAGIFEMTSLKNHCLTKCRNPFGMILSQFRPAWLRIYRIGLEQGVYCLGCCWALMLLMFAAGLMNFGWMAILGALMAAQKHGLLPRFERRLGIILIISGLAQIGVSVA